LLATFRIVLKLLVEEEKLFTGRKDEIGPAVGALENFVYEVHPASLAFARSTRSNSATLTARPDRPTAVLRMPACCDTPDCSDAVLPKLDKGPWWQRARGAGPVTIDISRRTISTTAEPRLSCGEEEHRRKAGNSVP